MDTKIPDHWKELRLEFVEPVKKSVPEKYKTYKVLINDYDEYKNIKKTPLPPPNRPKPLPNPHPKCIIQ